MQLPERIPASSVILALGIALGGFLAGHGVVRAKAAERYVTVKGVAEREAVADLAIWPLRLVSADNDLARANAELQTNVARVRRFLARHGVDTTQITLQDFVVRDKQANEYGGQMGGPRYLITQTVLVRSTQPEVVAAASQRVAELVNEGVVLSSGEQYGNGGPTFVFTGLNALKPEMIAQATARAREAAQQFAADAGSSLGGIRQANQGYFEILPRDQAQGIGEASQVKKTIRVVATVEYLLK
ncbi:MAG: SIMPL domain-containing protein [Gemmatimonadaceae bacterium]|nr:SIMPL domain-containing protein [Gemmatimonadaceae bacterium]MCW5827641.1 SIMPL domain-containing protein [Gemmatimonadaceae bacterium]